MIALVISREESVRTLKKKIKEKTGTPKVAIHLTFVGRRLADGDQLKAHLIGRHTTVQMTLNLHGGMVTDGDADGQNQVRFWCHKTG